MPKQQKFKVIVGKTPQDYERQMNTEAETARLGVLNTVVSEGDIISLVAVYPRFKEDDSQVKKYDRGYSPQEQADILDIGF